MLFKAGCLFITLLIGSIALPLNEEEDMSIFFDHRVTDPFIIGGTVAMDPVPHMVALTTGILTKNFFCGGSIINERIILTAAHCIGSVYNGITLLSSFRGIIGSNKWSTGNTVLNFTRPINHPKFVFKTLKNDISLLVTAYPITFTEIIQPVILNFDFIGGNVPAIANGWGTNVFGGPASEILMELRPLTVDSQQCIADMARIAAELDSNPPPIDPQIEICTLLEINRGLCNGDSGSALILKENKKQIGIVSWGMPCAQGAPDIFVRISAYQSWIEQQLEQITI